MVLAVREARVPAIGPTGNATRSEEAVVICPRCKAIQTVWINGGSLMPTRKFMQVGDRIYHDCGADKACRLFFGW